MQSKQLEIVVFIMAMCFAKAPAMRQYENTLAGKISSRQEHENRQETWQPMAQNNWIILNAASKDAAAIPTSAPAAPASAPVATASILTPNNHRISATYAYNSLRPNGGRNSHHLLTNSNANTFTNIPAHTNTHTHRHSQSQLSYQRRQWEKEQMEQPERLAVNYYTYNNSNTGIYHQQPTAPDVKLIEPYILTISKMRTHTNPSVDAVLNQRIANQATTPFVGGGIKLPKDVIGNAVPPRIGFRQDIDSNSTTNVLNSIDTTDESKPNDNVVAVDEVFNEMKADGAHLNEILLPLQHTLNKVIYFCDMAKRFISDTDIDEEDDETTDVNDLIMANRASELTPAIGKASLAGEVQGQNSMLPTTSIAQRRSASNIRATTTALTSVGTGRKVKKLKKKLSKFILPLLLAYKLKFLTLIPVLIGGLTLLVGTTGLAGFFFALFTAVMSLKSSGSSKSIIVKKI